MTAFLITALAVLASSIYLFIGGVLGTAFYRKRVAACSDCQRERRGAAFGYCLDMHWMPALLVGAGWPLALPAVGGVLVVDWVASKESRLEQREKRKEADHNRKMAELKAQREMTMESVRFLVENGIQADVPGLYEVPEESR